MKLLKKATNFAMRLTLFALFIFFLPKVNGQAITAGTAPVLSPNGGFAIDGNLQANTPEAGVGDWQVGVAGAGGNVLDAAGIPVVSGTTFHVLDAYGSTDNTFSGGLKSNDNPNSWSWSKF